MILILISQEGICQNTTASDSIAKTESNKKATNNFSLSTRLTSNYVWRDIISNYPALQPSASYSFGSTGFAFNFWSSYGTRRKSNDLEISTTFSYTYKLSKNSSFFVGYVYYLAPVLGNENDGYNLDTNFSEAMIGVNFNLMKFQVNNTNFFSNKGEWYSNLGFTRQVSVFQQPFTFQGSLGYRSGSKSINDGFRDFTCRVASPISIPYVKLNVFIAATTVLRTKKDAFQIGIDFTFQ